MSPEAIRGERPTPAFDLWALAVVLYEALAGRHPFAGADILAIHARIAAGAPADVRVYRPDVPETLAAFLARALAFERAVRPADAGTFVTHLRTLRADVQAS
jgi:serine/threonine protein kinase